MKKLFITAIFWILLNISAVSASSPVYPTSEAFLRAEGMTCERATDGCNSIGIMNGALGAMTEMYCEDTYGPEGKEEWMCLDEQIEEETLWFMSENDRNYYLTLQTQIDEATRLRVVDLIENYGSKILEKLSWNTEKSVKAIEKSVTFFESALSELSMKTPADAAMSEADTKIYRLLQYARFELQIMMHRWKTNAGSTQMPEDYVIGGIYDITKEACDEKKGTFTYDWNGLEVCIVLK